MTHSRQDKAGHNNSMKLNNAKDSIGLCSREVTIRTTSWTVMAFDIPLNLTQSSSKFHLDLTGSKATTNNLAGLTFIHVIVAIDMASLGY